MAIENCELAKLESIILRDLSSFIERKYLVAPELLAEFKTYVDAEVERIKFSFVNSTVTLPKKRSLEVFVQYHEHTIIRLAGCLTRYVCPARIHEPSHTDAAALCRYLYEGLQDLLTFMAQHYSKYFDQHAWIPESYHAILVTEFIADIPKLRAGLSGKGFSEDLIGEALAPFEYFVRQTSSKYHRVIYLKQLQEELRALIEKPIVDPNDDIPLMWTLFDMNFNTHSYYQFLTERIRSYHETTPDLNERISMLTLALKLMQQRVPKPGYAFDPDAHSIRDQLIHWTQLELNDYLAKLSAPEIRMPSEEPDVRVKIDLSVAQLAYFIRLLIEDGVLHQGNITTLIRKIARTFETKRSDTISAKSLENRYYDVELGTRQSIRSILENMIRRIDNS